jgi:hypothetical protein
LDIAVNNPAHPVASRIPLFLNEYNNSGITEWLSGNQTLNSYAVSFAFGAYLVRNFGGAALILAMMTNSDSDEASVINAVKSLDSSLNLWQFNTLLEKFAEVLVFTGSSGDNMSFNKTHISNISGISYKFSGFNIETMVRKSGSGTVGPAIFKPTGTWSLHHNTFAVISDISWNNISGSLTLNLNKPYDYTKFFIMIN